MGCDIHLVVERRVGDKWIAVNTMNGHHRQMWNNDDKSEWDWSSPIARTRNYDRFGALAGVRREGPAPRGIPADVSETGRYLIDDYGIDGHSHSWLPLEDAVRIFLETEHGKISDHARKYPASFYFEVESEQLAEHRLIFWFDN